MNKIAPGAMLLSALAVTATILFPPYYTERPDGIVNDRGWAFILNWPVNAEALVKIDFAAIALELTAIVGVFLLMIFLYIRIAPDDADAPAPTNDGETP